MRDAVGDENRGLNPGATILGITMPATMIAEAANNHVWISCPNSSARESCWPSIFVRPDGVVTGRLRRNTAGVLVLEVDTDEEIYDSAAAWRDRAMDGILHSGTLVRDGRSEERPRL
jgi:deaminated glutathione amidase